MANLLLAPSGPRGQHAIGGALGGVVLLTPGPSLHDQFVHFVLPAIVKNDGHIGAEGKVGVNVYAEVVALEAVLVGSYIVGPGAVDTLFQLPNGVGVPSGL